MFSEENKHFKECNAISCSKPDHNDLVTNVRIRKPRGRSRTRKACANTSHNKNMNKDGAGVDDCKGVKKSGDADDDVLPNPIFKSFTSKFKGKY